MEKEIRYLKIDLKGQKILLGLAFLSLFTVYFIPLALILLGTWQILSGIIVGLKLKDQLRGKFLIACCCQLTLMGLVSFWEELGFGYPDSGNMLAALILVYIIIPFISAIWYLLQTKQTLEKLEGMGSPESRELEDVLDYNQ